MANFCSACGQAVAPDAKFCAGCGSTLGDTQPEPESPDYAVPVVVVNKGRGFFKNCLIVVGAVLGGLLLLIIVAGICTASESTDDGEQVSEPAATPIAITAQRLYEEREENATRYDDTYKGRLVRVTGNIARIDGGEVSLSISGAIGSVALDGIPREDQVLLNPNDQVVAVCTVGEYVLGTINLEKCQLQ